MAVNKNALIRYKTIDKCLQNQYRKWTLEDLIDACSDVLYEYEGMDKGVSKRTVQADIQMMRSDKLGYNAPIIIVDRKYYTYEDRDYSITNIPLSNQDLDKLGEAVEFLKQFKGFSHFKELGGMVQKLEDHIYSQKTHQKPVIDFEKNENLKGIDYLDPLYQAIIKNTTLKLTYKSFKAREENEFIFYPYLLKEYRNRWFILGSKQHQTDIINLALDRIHGIEESEIPFRRARDFDPATYFEHAIGASISPNHEPDEVVFFVVHKHAPYVITKPLHKSQREISRDYYGVTFSIRVQLNFELEKEILGFGDAIKVISPERLRQSIISRLQGGLDWYRTELNPSSLKGKVQQLEYKGSTVLNHIYTKREVTKMTALLASYFKRISSETEPTQAQRRLLIELPELSTLLFNKNLKIIIKSIDPHAFLTKALYFDKSEESNGYLTYHQDLAINVIKSADEKSAELVWKKNVNDYREWTEKEGVVSVIPPLEIGKNRFTIRVHLDDTTDKNGALKLLSGSHLAVHSPQTIATIVENSIPISTDVLAGGIQLIKPLILQASSKSTSRSRRRVIHLEFASLALQEGLEWAEKTC